MDRRHEWDETHMIIWAMIFDAIVGHALRAGVLAPLFLVRFPPLAVFLPPRSFRSAGECELWLIFFLIANRQ